jgi:hypothetical protein
MFTCIECGYEYNKTNGDTDERMCNDCMEGEQEYSITVTASFGVMAESKESAENYILGQFNSGNTNYTQDVEVSDD